MRVRSLTVLALTAIPAFAFAQTQPTHPSAYATLPTLPTFGTGPLSPCYPKPRYSFDYPRYRFNPNSSCYFGTLYSSYSIEPFEFPSTKEHPPSSATLDGRQAKSSIESKGYVNVSSLQKDARGIWRGKATMKDGRPVDVILDLEGNIYSEPNTLLIRIEPAHRNR